MKDATAKFFYTAVTSVVAMYTHCLDLSTVRRCVYNETLRQTAETVSLFIIFLKGKAPRKHSLHEKTAASVLLKLFISGKE